MKRILLLIGLSLVEMAATNLRAAVVFMDDFETGTLANWTTTATSPLDPSTVQNAVPASGQWSAFMNASSDRMHHNLIADNGGVEVSGHAIATWYIFDPGATAPATRIFNEVRGYSGGTGLPNGGTAASGTLAQLLAAGKYNTVTLPGEVFSGSKYQGRVTFGATAGWFNLNGPGSPNRSAGWHRFDVERLPDGSTILFYVDGILSRTITGAIPDPWDTMILGPGLGTTVGDAWIDGMMIQTVPPPSVTCPPDQTLTATGGSGAVVNYPPPATSGGCPPITVNCAPSSGSTFPVGTTTVNCTATDACGQTAVCRFNVTVRPLPGDPCTEPDNGTGTVTLPPPDCEYLSPDEVHMIIDGLPPGTTIELSASHRDFICRQPPGPCPDDCFTTDDCDPRNGATEAFSSRLQLRLRGTGMLAGWERNLAIPNVPCQSQVGPRTPGDPVQSFDTEMLAIQGQITGDPDFDLLRITAGSSFGLPSPGHTTLTRMPGGNWAVDSFFDITYRIDFVGRPGGVLSGRSGSTTGTIRMVAVRPTPVAPFRIICPADITTTTYSTGKVVNYLVLTQPGDCPLGPPPTVACNPPSGSTFPVGTTTVNCVGSNGCNEHPTCSFQVTVLRGVLKPWWFAQRLLPPPQGEYISPQQRQLYANGIILSNVSNRRFTQSLPPPPPGGSQVHSFGSDIEAQASTDGGQTWMPVAGMADVTVRVTHAGSAADGTETFDTEMLSLNLMGPGGIRLRESPTRASTGRTSLRPVPGGGYMIDSFFDVFTELSLDGGASWSPAEEPATMELRTDARTIPPIVAPTPILPPPVDLYVSSREHILLAQGVQIRNVRNKVFTAGLRPPAPGSSAAHTFDSQMDMELSLDGGQTWRPMRVPAAMAVQLMHRSTAPDGTQVYDTEMLQLDLRGGDLPPGVMIRESPTRRSEGGTALAATPDGQHRIGSFFDIFTELTVDGGQNWMPAPDPARVELICEAPPMASPSPNLPPVDGEYVSPAHWYALYAPGIIISNVSNNRFTQSFPPPPPGATETHSFGSQVECDLSTDSGRSWQRVSMPAQVTVSLRELQSDGSTRYFATEMLQLDISGGTMPIRLRESPTRASLGRTSLTQSQAGGPYHIQSFFDVFTELSLDGGASWSPSLTGPGTVTLRPAQCDLAIVCPNDIRVWGCDAAGLPVQYPAPTVTGTCLPLDVTCVPPSGSTFPPGTNTVTCRVLDGQGNGKTCTFTVVVIRDVTPPVITCPNNITNWTCAAAGQAVQFQATATDDCDTAPQVVCDPPSGSVFPPGVTTVLCSARDQCGNVDRCTFTVTMIHDTTPPRIICPRDIVQCFTNGLVVNYPPPSVTDDCDPTPTVVCDPPSGSPFPLGTTVVVCRAVDDCGHESKCDFTVTIVPDRRPVLTIAREDRFVVICWPKTCGCYILQGARDLNAPIHWVDVADVPTDFGDHYCVRIPIDRLMHYFRLIQCQHTTAPVYKVLTSGLTPDQASLLADAMGIPRGSLHLEGGAALFVDPQMFQAIPMQPIQDPALIDELTRASENDDGQLAFDAIDFGRLRQLRPLSPAAAIARFEAALREAALLPDAGEASATHTLFDAVDGRGQAMVEGQPIDTHVAFHFDLGGIPVTGPGAVVRAAFGTDGGPTALHYAWRQLQAGDPVALVPVEEAARRCAALYPNLRASGQPQLVYCAPSLLLPAVQKIVPCYECGGSARVGDGSVALMGSIIPATDDPAVVPIVTLDASAQGNLVTARAAVTGGSPPYSYQWLSSSTDLGSFPPVSNIEYMAEPRAEETSETIRVVVTDANGVEAQAVRTVTVSGGRIAGAPTAGIVMPIGGVSDYGTERAVSDMGASQQSGFNGRFNAEGITRRFNFSGTGCWERDFKEGATGLDHLFVDNADIAFYIGHGNGGGITFESNKDDGDLTYTDAAGAFGDGDLEFLALLSCQVLRDEYDGKKWDTRWGPTFAGLHLLLGFETNARDQSGFGAAFAQWTLGYQIGITLPPMPVRSSWFLAKAQAQPADRIAVAIGVIGPSNCSNYNDYFWGKGPVGPDIRGANIHGYWRVRYQ